MKAYSVDLRKKIVAAHLEQKLSIRKTAAIFSVSKSLVQKPGGGDNEPQTHTG